MPNHRSPSPMRTLNNLLHKTRSDDSLADHLSSVSHDEDDLALVQRQLSIHQHHSPLYVPSLQFCCREVVLGASLFPSRFHGRRVKNLKKVLKERTILAYLLTGRTDTVAVHEDEDDDMCFIRPSPSTASNSSCLPLIHPHEDHSADAELLAHESSEHGHKAPAAAPVPPPAHRFERSESTGSVTSTGTNAFLGSLMSDAGMTAEDRERAGRIQRFTLAAMIKKFWEKGEAIHWSKVSIQQVVSLGSITVMDGYLARTHTVAIPATPPSPMVLHGELPANDAIKLESKVTSESPSAFAGTSLSGGLSPNLYGQLTQFMPTKLKVEEIMLSPVSSREGSSRRPRSAEHQPTASQESSPSGRSPVEDAQSNQSHSDGVSPNVGAITVNTPATAAARLFSGGDHANAAAEHKDGPHTRAGLPPRMPGSHPTAEHNTTPLHLKSGAAAPGKKVQAAPAQPAGAGVHLEEEVRLPPLPRNYSTIGLDRLAAIGSSPTSTSSTSSSSSRSGSPVMNTPTTPHNYLSAALAHYQTGSANGGLHIAPRSLAVSTQAELCALAARKGHLMLLHHLHDHLHWAWDARTPTEAASQGHLACLKYAHESGDCDWYSGTIAADAAENGHLACLQYVLSEGAGLWTSETCRLAAAQGHLGVLKAAHEAGCDWNELSCAYASRFGRLEVLQFCHEHGCPWDERTSTMAASAGALDCLMYAHNNGAPWNEKTCAAAAAGGHLPCLKYAFEHGCPWDNSTIQNALEGGHFSVLKYALQHDCRGSKNLTREELQMAAAMSESSETSIDEIMSRDYHWEDDIQQPVEADWTSN